MEALMAIQPGIRRGRVFSRDPEHRGEFAVEMRQRYEMEMHAATTQ